MCIKNEKGNISLDIGLIIVNHCLVRQWRFTHCIMPIMSKNNANKMEISCITNKALISH